MEPVPGEKMTAHDGSDTVITVRDLAVEYPVARSKRSFVALRDVNLDVYRGEILTVLGPSGCGKTTMLNVIAGLVGATSGEVLVNGKPVTGPGPDRAVVFQDYALLPWRTVYDNVRFGIEMQPKAKQVSREQILETITLVGLAGFEQAYPRELSGGMQQRVGIARALVAEPEILLMDEPLGAVDALTRDVMRAEIARIIGVSRKTVVFVTHSIDEAILLGDRIVVFQSNPGRITEILPCDIPRPRTEETARVDSEYLRLRDHLWRLLQGEIPGTVPQGHDHVPAGDAEGAAEGTGS